VSDAALTLIASVGFDPVFGARPLKRAIQHYVENTLAHSLLRGDILPNSVIVIDVLNGELSVSSKPQTV